MNLYMKGNVCPRAIYILYILLLLSFSECFIIQERSTRKYLKSFRSGRVSLVPSIDQATLYETSKIRNSPIVLSINVKGLDMVLDYSGGREPLITYPYHGQANQQFSLTLDNEGYYQIVQGNSKFLRYDRSTNSLVGGPFMEGIEMGFLLWTDDGRTCYPGHGKEPGKPPFDMGEPPLPNPYGRFSGLGGGRSSYFSYGY